MKIKCVTGSPGAGKSTYVNEHCGENDIIFDYDKIFQAVTNRASHSEPTEGQSKVISSLRYSMINAVNKASDEIDTFWMIAVKPNDNLKEALGEDCEYIEIEVDADTAKERIDNDDSREDKDAEHDRVDKFFEGRGKNMSDNPITNIENLMNEKNVQFRDFRLCKIETRNEGTDDEELILEGVPCVFDTETVMYSCKDYECREKIAAGAFDGCDMTDVIFNMNHCGRVYSRTRNGSLSLWVEADGLHSRAILMANDEGHRQLYRDIKSGLLDKMSFAFTVEECTYEYIERENEPIVELRTITKIDRLYDVSAVDIPAYDTTSISARRAFDSERSRREAESRQRQEENEKALALAKAKYKFETLEVE